MSKHSKSLLPASAEERDGSEGCEERCSRLRDDGDDACRGEVGGVPC